MNPRLQISNAKFYKHISIVCLVFVIFNNEAIAQFLTITRRLRSSFCMHMYGCELWSSSHIDKHIIAWRKIMRRIWKIAINSHKRIVHN